MPGPIRAGGHIIRESGWELEHPPGTAASESPQRRDVAGEAPPTAASQPEKAECPDCGKKVIVNKNGTLRKHTCVIDAPPPQVTFDDEEEENDDG